jgi:hypothetical protein
VVAVLYGQHARLGADSLVKTLDEHMLMAIANSGADFFFDATLIAHVLHYPPPPTCTALYLVLKGTTSHHLQFQSSRNLSLSLSLCLSRCLSLGAGVLGPSLVPRYH